MPARGLSRQIAIADDQDTSIPEGQYVTASNTALKYMYDMQCQLQSPPADWFAGAADDGLKDNVEHQQQKRIGYFFKHIAKRLSLYFLVVFVRN